MAYKTIFLLMIGLLFQCKMESQNFGSVKGEGDIVRQEINLQQLHGVSLSISGDLELIQGNTQKVILEGQANVLDHISREVKNGFWNIEFTKRVSDSKPVKIILTVPNLDEVGLCGSGSVFSSNTFSNLDKLEINVSGSGKLVMGLESNRTEINLSGSGDIDLKGKSTDVEINISGSGDVSAKELKSASCEVSISGSGDASVHVDGDLDTSISGSGDVTYQGNASVHASISGSGTVKKM